MTVVTRLLALAVAVALVVGALAVRQRRDGGDGAAGPTDPTAADVATLLCPAELGALCEDVAADVGVAGTAAEMAVALGEDDAGPMLLPAAWVDVVDDDRARRGLAPAARSEVIASTPLLVVAFEDRATVLAATCGIDVGALGWACVGEHVGARWEDLGGDERWGDVRVGHLPPDTATGLQATAGVVAARAGMPFALAELRDVGVASWFRQVERAVTTFSPPGGSHLTGMVTRGPAAANVASVTEAELTRRDLATTFGDLVVTVPDPLFAVELVVAGGDRSDVDDVVRALDVAKLAAAGWRTDPSTAPVGAPRDDLPPPAASPSGGVLTAVRSAWDDAVG